jgi:Zn-dependent M16 (insulinase) family peptidase
VDGVGGLPFYGALQKQSKTPEGIAEIATQLADLHKRIVSRAPTVLCSGIEDDAAALGARLQFRAPPATPDGVSSHGSCENLAANAALHAVSQINHCVIAWKVPGEHHPDAAALAVTAVLISNQVLHQALREKGGAYGGSARYEGNAGIFSMASFRDPRLAGTYADFDSAIQIVLESEFSAEQVEEAIIGVIKVLDRPETPHAEVLSAWNMHHRGLNEATRTQFRSGVLSCTMTHVKAATKRWLRDGLPSRAAFVGDVKQDLVGLKVIDLSLTSTGFSGA